MAEINTIHTLFSKQHWKTPFTIKANLQMPDGTTRTVTAGFSKKAKVTIITLLGLTLLPSFGLNILVIMPMLAYLKQKKINQKIKKLGSPSPTPPSPIPPSSNTQSLLPDPGPLPPPPATGITVGIPNVGNTCWLNAVLKMLACDPNFDEIYNQKEFPPFSFGIPANAKEEVKRALIQHQTQQIQELQRTLKVVIYQLRTQSTGKLDINLCLRLVDALPILMPEQNIHKLEQQEAAEALNLIQARFGWPNTEGIDQDNPTKETKRRLLRSLNLYEFQGPGPEMIKYASLKHFGTPTVTLTFTPEEANKLERLDIGQYYYNEHAHAIDVPSDFDLTTLQATHIEKSYLLKQIFINLPEHLYINLQRNLLDAQGRMKKNTRSIQVDECGTLELMEHDPGQIGVLKDGKTLAIMQKCICVYEIATAIIHHGGEGGGHYTCVEKTLDGRYFYHNDSSVSEYTSEQALKLCAQAAYLGLRLVRKIPASGFNPSSSEQLLYAY
ncbi:hypothetical protein [Parachlamydia sp. AcF125]|uniref:hypothetical protein n=1 Tax=Parachlamydia sp. AcF125 TaxID=2795736 RepID=UPI001BC9BC32|nr:hypothetical protein [Parachlamydia sp. AcF125]MBS4167935.1 hypothetical protein [Parachlamydia sp. AcF125]